MISKVDFETFENAIVGQDDDNYYQESGYVACVFGDIAAIAKYDHCSCFGTWTAIHGGDWSDGGREEIAWDWQGTVEQLVQMATDKSDPDMPSRTASPDDYDYDHLIKMYDQVLEWHRKRAEGQ